MPDFDITSPEGQKFRVTAPEGATQDQFVKIFKESGKTVVFKKDVDAKLEEIRRAS